MIDSGDFQGLLYGFLALQNNFISREDLIAAVSVWLQDKSKPLGQILRDRKSLRDEEFQLVDALARLHLKKHNDDPEKSLAAISSLGSVAEELKQFCDPQMQASLAAMGAIHGTLDAQDDRTLMPQQGTEAVRFRILRPHARGGLGQVFVARDAELNREIALKEIHLSHSHDKECRSRFVLEAEVTGGLEHPGIVPVYGLGQYADGRPYYAMRFIRGDSLKEAIERFHASNKQPLTSAERTEHALQMRNLLGRFVDVCNAIQYAHSRGDRAYSMNFDSDGRRLAVGYFNTDVVSIRNADDGKILADLPTGSGRMTTVAWHPDGNLLAASVVSHLCLM